MEVIDFQPILKRKAIVVKSANYKQMDTMVMIIELGPHETGLPMHMHPSQQETFEVLEGEADFIFGNVIKHAVKGDRIEIPPKTPHSIKNTTGAWLRMRDTLWPALGFEEQLRELHGLVHKGKVTGFRDLKSKIYLSMLCVKYEDVHHSVKYSFKKMKLLASVGKFMGYKI
jgi:mannose-6-phosphate isomerase-like protein (cupin superfamily)